MFSFQNSKLFNDLSTGQGTALRQFGEHKVEAVYSDVLLERLKLYLFSLFFLILFNYLPEFYVFELECLAIFNMLLYRFFVIDQKYFIVLKWQ